ESVACKAQKGSQIGLLWRIFETKPVFSLKMNVHAFFRIIFFQQVCLSQGRQAARFLGHPVRLVSR
ncbi:MAG: hypothetical protein J0665_16745, partial [Deltaproteobacteria bacterium]|nr:hypothetical protein [Deltaproteobacteria bacterium]